MSYGVDLAILSQCNHTVLDYGTFGLWAALFAGGRIILPGKNVSVQISTIYNIKLCHIMIQFHFFQQTTLRGQHQTMYGGLWRRWIMWNSLIFEMLQAIYRNKRNIY